jgi:hypothetical protein
MARRTKRRHCVWCPRDVGSLEVCLDRTWKPVCRVCFLARPNKVARSWAEVESGERYVFRSKAGAMPDRSRRARNREPLTLPLLFGTKL